VENEITKNGLQPKEFKEAIDLIMCQILSVIIKQLSQKGSMEKLVKDLDQES